MKKLLAITIFAAIAGLAAACSNAPETTTNKTVAPTNTTANAPAANTAAPKTEEDAPASVKAAFPDAQTFTKQHKDIPADAIADIEKDTGAKVPDTDHHSYLAFTTKDGTKTQLGAATIVNFTPKNSKATDDKLVIVYESKNGQPIIKEVRYDTAFSGNRESRIQNFVKLFAGKGHDDKFKLGEDLKIDSDNDLGEAIAKAVHVDVMTMQKLYGAAHSH